MLRTAVRTRYEGLFIGFSEALDVVWKMSQILAFVAPHGMFLLGLSETPLEMGPA
jgi:hypothetical protein